MNKTHQNIYFGMLLVAPIFLTAQNATAAALEEVVVTATKRAVNLQSVPVAISAVTGDELADRNINETSDLMGSMPNLQVTSAYGKTQPNFSIRGVSVANEFSAATASPIGIYVDEVYQTFRPAHGQQLFDLKQVEVIRGPQGTLFGRNTTGGAISFETRKPDVSGDSNGYITLGAGNLGSFQASGAYESSIIEDKLAFRIAGTTQKADGYTHNPIDNEDYGEVDSKALRLSIAWEPTDNLRGDIKVYTAKNDSDHADLPYGIGYNAGGTNVIGLPLRNSSITGRPLAQNEIESNTGNGYNTSSDGFSMQWKYDINENWSVKSITGYDKADIRLSPFDCDGSAVNICAIRYFSESESFNQDFRLSFEGESIKFVGGVYIGTEKIYTHNNPDFFGFLNQALDAAPAPISSPSFFNPVVGTISPNNPALGVLPDGALGLNANPLSCNPVTINPNGFLDARSFFEFLGASNCGGTAPPFTSILADQKFDLERPSKAIYGELNYSISEDTSLTVGLRFTADDVKFRNARTVLFSEDGIARATTIPYSFPANLNGPTVNREESSEEITGRVILDHHFTEELFGYVSYSHGYRAGTYNALAYQDITQVYFLEPETVDAIEVGFKSRFFDDSVQLNASFFQYDYENQQIAEIVGTTSFLRSANGELKGAEFELQAAVSDDLLVRAALGLLDTEYDANQVFVPGGLDIGGNQFPNAPETTFVMGLDWVVARFDDAQLKLNVEAKYMDEYQFDPFGDYRGNYVGNTSGKPSLASAELALGNPDYWLLDARATYETDKYKIGIWGKNLTDEFYYVYGLNLNAFQQDYFTRGGPRTYGIDVTYQF